MYFPTLDQLLLDATVGLLSESAVDGALETERYGDDVVARADALARAFVETADEALPFGRKILKLTVDAPGRTTARAAATGASSGSSAWSSRCALASPTSSTSASSRPSRSCSVGRR